ncbi:hypothetical protein AbraIFM66951_001914 [Aspergillus brasiliensis]|uniref:SGNH hydrolase-type esterase domain-containing protein n=1 Tax=Aspergillus brasiliensis TaxID=319629 RepID=A0A9W5YLN8_9EURO|nr:hypothetical protein AbraCBS73388_002711 [Aspergillus brasiliensis]GKZ42520.1 hypothetical protein AbraIFM66951_001914 [Aspergillus brasiliensis]
MSDFVRSRSWWLPSPGSRGLFYLYAYLAALYILTPVVHAAVAVEPGASDPLSQLADHPLFPLATTNEDSETWTQATSPMHLGDGKKEQDFLQMMALMNDAKKTEPTSTDTMQDDSTLRVMIVGDSMSQGKEGDYTWRYRIWEWFRAQNIAMHMVGPYTGTAPSEPQAHGELQATLGQPKTSGGYAPDVSPDFDRHHFAVWGRVAAVDKDLIYDVLSAHQADLMLLMLGFNDMAWFQSDASGTLDSIRTLVINARAANPNLKFAIANVPQRSFIPGREDLPINTNIYNALLRNAIPEWSTADSPIHLVELQENYDCGPNACPAGYDGLHPNAAGEYQIARAFSLTLVNGFGIGGSPLTIPDHVPERSHSTSFNF